MLLHPEIARWMVVAEQERVAELARRSHPRPVTRRHRRRHNDTGAKEA